MKKKILLTLLLVSMLSLVFAVTASAAIVYKTADGTTLFTAVDENADRIFDSYEGSFPNTDENGNALTWYIVSTETTETDTVHTVASFNTIDTTGEHASLSDGGQYKYVNQAKELSVVSVYFPDDANVLTISMSDSGYGNAYGHGSDKSNLLFLRLPNTLTDLPSRICQATNVIDCTVADSAPFETISNTAFYDCTNLRSVDISANVTLIQGSNHSNNGFAFYNCISLVDVDFSENSKLVTIDQNAFNSCKALVEITIPNTVVNLGNNAFMYCSSLTTIRLGANAGKGLDTYNVQSMLYGCNSLKYVYMSDTMVPTSGSHLFDSGASGMVIFYTGDQTEYEALKAILTTLKNNGKFVNATAMEWDATKDDQYYKDLAATEKKNYVVYGYNTCNAFYDGKHTESGTPTYKYNGEEYLSNYVAISACSVCGITDSETVVCGPLFTNKGYAKEENGSLFTYGIVVDKDEIAKYVAHTGKAFNYGMIVAAGDLVNDGALFDESAKAIDGTIIIDVTTTKYTVYQLKMTGIKDTQKDLSVYACAYVIDGTAVSYIGEETTDSAVAISYNQIKALITNNTTGNGEATENTDAA